MNRLLSSICLPALIRRQPTPPFQVVWKKQSTYKKKRVEKARLEAYIFDIGLNLVRHGVEVTAMEIRDGIHHASPSSDPSDHPRMGTDHRNHLTVDVMTRTGVFGTMHAPTDDLEDRSKAIRDVTINIIGKPGVPKPFGEDRLIMRRFGRLARLIF